MSVQLTEEQLEQGQALYDEIQAEKARMRHDAAQESAKKPKREPLSTTDEAFLVRQAALAEEQRKAFSQHAAFAISDLRNNFPEHFDAITKKREWKYDGGAYVLKRMYEHVVYCNCHNYHVAACANLKAGDENVTVYRLRVADRYVAKRVGTAGEEEFSE